jgi:predicted ATP-grasp superfamily ATP-dependent carboligase
VTIVHYKRPSRPSARLLARRLYDAGYEGRPINYGFPVNEEAINAPDAIRVASHKLDALRKMGEAGVPVPNIYTMRELIETEVEYPLIGRKVRHRGGSDCYMCDSLEQARQASYDGADFFLKFLEDVREFRLHIQFGKSIKIAEKMCDHPIRTFKNGARFMYPDFNHKVTLRNHAKKAVQVLGLDFGAVDILYRDGEYWVLEVNTAPCLTSESDTIERYVRGFCEHASAL